MSISESVLFALSALFAMRWLVKTVGRLTYASVPIRKINSLEDSLKYKTENLFIMTIITIKLIELAYPGENIFNFNRPP